MNIAIIPARGGSKRIPRKNIKEFSGRPMIAYAINSAKASGLFERIVVSTDDDEIAAISNQWGAETPFKRPSELSDDHTPTLPVIGHAIETCRNKGWEFENVCCIYPCVPFLQAADLVGSFNLLKEISNGFSFSISEFPSVIQRALNLLANKKVEPFFPENQMLRTQDINRSFFDAGQFYWGGSEMWLSKRNIHSNGFGYVIPKWRSIDVDTPEDWQLAELLFKTLNQ